MLKISSRDNQRIKQARKVRDSLVKDAIFVEGVRLAEEVLRSSVKISDVFFSETSARLRVSIFCKNACPRSVRAKLSEKKNVRYFN